MFSLQKRSNSKQDIQKLISQWLPQEKVFQVDKHIDALNLLRKIGNQKQRKICQRDKRPHLLAEHLEYSIEEGCELGVLKVSGYLKGQMLCVNSLIHIPGWGDFQIKQIDGLNFHNKSMDEHSSLEFQVLQVADPKKQASLDTENIPDPMDAEQTWPTEEEIKSAEEEQSKKKLIKRIPKGMSEYQACWIPDDEIEEIDDDEIIKEEEMVEENIEKAISIDESEEEFGGRRVTFDDENSEIITVTEGDIDVEKYDESIDVDVEKQERENIRKAKEDQIFPDEIDTPLDMPARLRFQKYRGLLSFRTSPWDPKENLPFDYARIFQFENFNKTKKRVFNDLENGSDGVFVRLLRNFYYFDLKRPNN